jgi:acyl phosphate:glycerol-3-phosphate acyltransferase
VTLTVALLAYLIGSLSFAVIVSRLWNLPDPRTYGSGNPGATNVLRSGRKSAAIATLLGDGLKGWVGVYLAQRIAGPDATEAVAVAALAVTLGHMYPLFFKLQGGKGVATALGVLLALNVYLAAGALATWIIIAVFFRISSLAALVSAVFAPFFTFFLYGAAHPYFAAVSAMCLLLVWRHRTNIRKLLNGTEGRIDAARDA